jgi:NAD(P)-dependent dehydrogenase (short-subunit alcohol dehydrogenase family)
LLRVKKATGLPDADVFVLPIDVEKAEDIEPKAQQAIKHFGRIDVLFNNAGISQRSSVEETEMAVYQR